MTHVIRINIFLVEEENSSDHLMLVFCEHIPLQIFNIIIVN